MFDHNSRYWRIDTLEWTSPDGRVVQYKARRFCPQGESLPTLGEVRVRPADRLDRITARTLGRPEFFWQIADANDSLDPSDLVVPGVALKIPTPQPGGGS